MNRGYAYRSQVGAEAEGVPASAWLARHHPHSSLEVWERRVREGEVEVQGARAAADPPLSAGQWIVWHRPPWEEPPVPTDFPVLAEDASLLAVSKPSGLPTVPGGGFLENTLLGLVRLRDPRWTPLHRLGRGTSGVLLFARGDEAKSAVLRAWREGGVEKDYLAVVAGTPTWETLDITQPIGPVAHPRLGSVHAALDAGRPSRSHVEVSAPGAMQSICRVRIATGRPHQIRIHLAWAGHPLVGDPLYAAGGTLRADLDGTTALPGDLGYRLHSHRLTVPHPDTGQRVRFEAAVPPGYEAQ